MALEDGCGDGTADATVLTDGSPILTVATRCSINKPEGNNARKTRPLRRKQCSVAFPWRRWR